MMNKLMIPAFAAVALLAGCNNENKSDDHTIVAGSPGDSIPAPAKIDPSLLPPPIVATKTYRCKDNSLVYIDWLADEKGANFRAAATDPATRLMPGTDGKPPFVAEGYSLAGTATASSITLTRPDKGAQVCKG